MNGQEKDHAKRNTIAVTGTNSHVFVLFCFQLLLRHRNY